MKYFTTILLTLVLSAATFLLVRNKALAATLPLLQVPAPTFTWLGDVAPQFGFWQIQVPDGTCYLYLDSQQSGLQCNFKKQLAASPSDTVVQLTQMCTTLTKASISAAGLTRVCSDIVGYSDGCDHGRDNDHH